MKQKTEDQKSKVEASNEYKDKTPKKEHVQTNRNEDARLLRKDCHWSANKSKELVLRKTHRLAQFYKRIFH